MEIGVDFFRLSNFIGIFKGFREDSGVFGLLELLGFGLEVLYVVLVWFEGICVCFEDKVVFWFCIIFLYLLVMKFIWLLMLWFVRRRLRFVIKFKIIRVFVVKKEGKDLLYWLEFFIWG